MDNKNYKEFFAINAFLLLSMMVFGVFGFDILGMACASAAVCCCMLKSNKAAIIVSIILAFAADSLVNLSFSYVGGIIICMSAFSVNFAIRGKKSLVYIVAYGCLGIFVSVMILLAIGQTFDINGMRPADLRAVTDAASSEVLNVIKQSGAADMYTTGQISQIVDIVFMSMVPAAAITAACVYSYVCVAVVKKIEKKLKSGMCDYIAPFTKIKADKMCAAVMTVSFLVYMFAAKNNVVVCASALCMLFLIMIFYYVSAISLFAFIIEKQSGAKKVLMYVMLVFAALVFSPAMTVTGIFDSFADMRKIAERR